jgi:rubrerythrin
MPPTASSLPADLPSSFAAAYQRLTSQSRLEVEDMKLMILLELSGEPLYMRLAELAPSEEAADLLRKNGREETAHAHRLKRAIEILTGKSFRMPSLAENPYATPPPIAALSPELLLGLAGAEKGGDLMYQRYADCESNPEVAELLRQNGREETRHGERVEKVIQLLRGRVS